MALNRIAQIPGRVTNLEAEQMSGVAIPRRTTGDMVGLLLDGSDDDELEGEEWDEDEEDWDDEEWDEEEDDGIYSAGARLLPRNAKRGNEL